MALPLLVSPPAVFATGDVCDANSGAPDPLRQSTIMEQPVLEESLKFTGQNKIVRRQRSHL